MRKMKNSGIEWIGEIPADWEMIPIKYLVSYNDETLSENTTPDFEFDYIEIGSVEYGKGITSKEHLKFSQAPSRARRIVRTNDIIVSTVRTYLRAVAPITSLEDEQIASTGFIVIRPKNVVSSFLRYAILSENFICTVEANSTGISYPAINASQVVQIKIPVPSTTEQQRIADCLDRKCAEIDAVIERTKATIEEYKKLRQAVISEAVAKGVRGSRQMKDVGMACVGEIPKDWKFLFLKYVTDFQEGPGIMGNDFRDEGIPLIRISGMKGNYVTREGCNYLDPVMVDKKWTHFKLQRGDVVISASASMGIAALVDEEAEGCIPYTGLIRFPANDILDNTFLRYYLVSCEYMEQINVQKTGTAIQHYGPTHIEKVKIALPSIEEQKEIADYLDQHCMSIDKLITDKTHFLAELETYKKAVIFEYVTGKKEVGAAEESATTIIYPYFPAVLSTKKARFAQAVLMSRILDKCRTKMGRVKLEKMLYTIETSIGFDFDTEYVRHAAGPLDNSVYECEGIISRRNKWYTKKEAKYGVSYTPTKDSDKYKKYYDKYFADYDSEIERIIGIFMDYDADDAEIVATLFAAWNDFIIDQKQFTDDELVDEVLNNWNDSKKRFSRAVWLQAIEQMRQNNIVPKGYGKRTVVKN